jgi:hypothetical protein
MNPIDIFRNVKENNYKPTTDLILGKGGHPFCFETEKDKVEVFFARPVLMKDSEKLKEIINRLHILAQKSDNVLSEASSDNINNTEMHNKQMELEEESMNICLDLLYLLLVRNHPGLKRENLKEWVDSYDLRADLLINIAKGLHTYPDF